MKLIEYIVTVVSFIIKPQKRKLIKLSYSLKNKIGLEIGGPSSIFKLKSYFPVYLFANQVDGVNYSTETVWEGKIKEGKNYHYTNNKCGYQFVLEASNLNGIKDNSYDFLLSSHSLEHIANPIQAVKEWYRVLKPGGTIVLALPDKKRTFDRNRAYTTLEHLIEDFEKNVTENDTTHYDEIFQLHDLSRDAGVSSVSELKERTLNNSVNRCVHHHVYSFDLLQQTLLYCGFRPIYEQEAAPFHLVIIAKK